MCGCCKALKTQFQYFQSVVASGCFTVRVDQMFDVKLPGDTLTMISPVSFSPHRANNIVFN